MHIGKTKIKSTVEFLESCIDVDEETVNWGKIAANYHAGKGFEEGFQYDEFPHHAGMINHMQNHQKLKELVGLDNLYFVASKIVLSRGNEDRLKIDIVAHNGVDNVFFLK